MPPRACERLCRGYLMFSRDLVDSPANRDAIDGFDAIASALDRGIDPIHGRSSRLSDFLAIAAGWLVLGTIILYPSLQLAAIVVCAAFLCTRSCARLILGPSPSAARLPEDRSMLAA
jgi:hypothetical protein